MRNVAILSILLVGILRSVGDQSTNPQTLRAEFARELLGYSWEAQTRERQVPARIVEVAKIWAKVATIVAFAPPDDADITIHKGEEKTCDAIRISYKIADDSISIIQTPYAMLFVIEVSDAEIAKARKPGELIDEAKRKILQPITSQQSESGKSLFCPEEAWTDGRSIYIFGSKVPGKPSPLILPANLKDGGGCRWFSHLPYK